MLLPQESIKRQLPNPPTPAPDGAGPARLPGSQSGPQAGSSNKLHPHDRPTPPLTPGRPRGPSPTPAHFLPRARAARL